MKAMRVLLFCIGLAAAYFIADYIFHTRDLPWNMAHIRALVLFWPKSIVFALSHPQMLSTVNPRYLAVPCITLAAPMLALFFTRRIGRSGPIWFFLTVFFPFVLTCLAFLGISSSGPRAKTAPPRVKRFFGVLLRFVFSITALGGILGVILSWIGFAQYLFDLVSGPKDRSGWVIMGTADEFLSWDNFLLSVAALIIGILGTMLGEKLEKG